MSSLWWSVCEVERLTVDRGVAALVNGRGVAIFLLRGDQLHAIDNDDPCSGAGVLSRGLIGDVDGEPTVASPMYKQRFELRTGRCLDADASVDVHEIRAVDGVVEVRLAPR